MASGVGSPKRGLVTELVRALSIVDAPPNQRTTPIAGDRQDKYFDAWFDGGAMYYVTGGGAYYECDDGLHIHTWGFSPRFRMEVKLPDGCAVRVEQTEGPRRAVDAEDA